MTEQTSLDVSYSREEALRILQRENYTIDQIHKRVLEFQVSNSAEELPIFLLNLTRVFSQAQVLMTQAKMELNFGGIQEGTKRPKT